MYVVSNLYAVISFHGKSAIKIDNKTILNGKQPSWQKMQCRISGQDKRPSQRCSLQLGQHGDIMEKAGGR